MELYAITRRHAWPDAAELEAANGRAQQVCDDQMGGRVRWIRSYVVEEDDGTLGTICLYAAVTPEAIRRHARLARLPLEQIIRLSDEVIVPPVWTGTAERETLLGGVMDRGPGT
jgi:Protein of unknown function (DUF4242)